MEELLKELEALLVKHAATILRSASEEGKLVISLPTEDGDDFEQIEFDEEINDSMLKHKWFKKVA